jgi:iron(III) transport system ATP-binding protein
MITVEQILKVFHTKESDVYALDHVDLQVDDGEFFVLLGPSGSGKTTLLRCVGGLEEPDAGQIHLGNDLVYSGSSNIIVPPERRRVGMVFQSYAIWPHMTVADNVGLPLREGNMKVPKDQVEGKVQRALELVGLQDLGARPAPMLSGGQQQRVALARALAVEPRVLLMDEPLSNLDARLREEVRAEIKNLAKKMGLTVLYVTHDQEEAMDLADRIAVMHLGQILQLGSPEELYTNPADPRVAQFFGEMNWVNGEMADGGVVTTSFGAMQASIKGTITSGTKVRVGVRPEHVELMAERSTGAADGQVFDGEIISETFLGDKRTYTVKLGDTYLSAWSDPENRMSGQVSVGIETRRALCFADASAQGKPASEAAPAVEG